ncbi:MAG TPA: 16S rRNA (guanine(527)-N(7))-methyltransferase RsmG [Bryobacteraceae bacterium]|nr:16S rRNA (guanine(527)-N(7))-methyltransferase RsmG [Bryobacteraceae bacterium]
MLPTDLPNREMVISKAAKHLELIVEANQQFNLTRILDPREAAIKHVLDSVMPWRYFEGARTVLDAGTGAGFPGIPLAVVLPKVTFQLSESIGKKARFVETTVQELGLTNASVVNQRAEEIADADIITARAVAPILRAVVLFGTAFKNGVRAILYKGPDVQLEIEAAAAELKKRRLRVDVLERYDLPEAFGSRTIVQIARLKQDRQNDD